MPSGIYDRSDQSGWKPNSGRFKKGEHRNPDAEFKKGQRASPETEFKVGNSLRKGHGKYHLADYLKKQSESHKGQRRSIRTEFKKGFHYAIETEFKLGQPQIYNPLGSSRPEYAGKKHPNWQGGISPIKVAIRNSGQYHEWRIGVFKRDNFTCQECGKRGGKLEAHHDMPFSEAPLFLLDISNGKTLCYACHKTNHFGKKEVICEKGHHRVSRK